MATAAAKKKPTKVLVTGATGYLAEMLIRDLLTMGMEVRGTVRNIKKAQHTIPLNHVNFEAFEADLLKALSFAEAMEGCSIVFHVASTPYLSMYEKRDKEEDPYEDVVASVVKGTKNVLNQARKTPSVRRIVLTSCVEAMFSDITELTEDSDDDDEDSKSSSIDKTKEDKDSNSSSSIAELNESCWNDKASLEYQPYAWAKAEAEKDAWDKMERQEQWDLITICPGLILGPARNCRRSHAATLLLEQCVKKSVVKEWVQPIADVREVSKAHLEAAFRPNASGRYLVAHDTPMNHYEIAQILEQKYPELYSAKRKKSALPRLAAFQNGWDRKWVKRHLLSSYSLHINNSRSIKELGIQYRPIEETLCDTMEVIIADGLLDETRMAQEEFKEAVRKKQARSLRRAKRIAQEALNMEAAKKEREEERERQREEKLVEMERIREEKEAMTPELAREKRQAKKEQRLEEKKRKKEERRTEVERIRQKRITKHQKQREAKLARKEREREEKEAIRLEKQAKREEKGNDKNKQTSNPNTT
mmetsp:Transcript_28695/g.43371  ORF Transcript_28695/g.43371 Transcript_28695/m.43371 type:complete len:533 (+) Transcript_28695:98-1696(+)